MHPGMRGTRAYLGALGAGMSMAVAASLALLVVSSVVAFRGWPDDVQSSSDPAVSALVAAPAAQRAGGPGAARFAALSLPAPHRVAAGRAAQRRGTRPRRLAVTAPAPGPSGSSATTDAPPAAGVSGSAAPATAPGAGSRVSAATDQVAGAVDKTTRTSAGAVAPVAPTVAGALTQIGAAGSTVVSGAGQAAGKAVDGLLPPR